MNNNIEEEIVNTFIKENKQTRIISELRNPEKRKTIMIRRFASDGLFKGNCIHLVSYMSPSILEKCLFDLSKDEEVYYIGEYYIGALPLHEAVLRANTGELCIIYCGKGIGYYQGEQDHGKPPRCFLYKNEMMNHIHR